MSSSLNIVIADDETHIIIPLQMFLERAGHSVRAAENAEKALELIASSPADILITDVDMGAGMDGIELVAELRNRHLMLPIIVMSTMDADRIREHLAGFESVAFLPKPFSPKHAIALLGSMTSAMPGSGATSVALA